MYLYILHHSRLVSECLKSALAAEKGIRAMVLDPAHPDPLHPLGNRPGDVLLVDLALENRAVDLILRTRRHKDRVRILLLVSLVHREWIAESVRAGAHGCVVEGCSLQYLRDAIRQVSAGETICSPEIVWSMFSQFAAAEEQTQWRQRADQVCLTPREQEVLRLIAEYCSNKQIAKRLSVSLYTVKNHVHNILEKLKVGNRQQAAELNRGGQPGALAFRGRTQSSPS